MLECRHLAGGGGDRHLGAVHLEVRLRQQFGAHDTRLARCLRIPLRGVATAIAGDHAGPQAVVELHHHLGKLIGAVAAAPRALEASLYEPRQRRRSGEHGDGKRVHAEVEQRATAPVVIREATPVGQRVERPHLEMGEGAEGPYPTDELADDGRIREVLGVQQPVSARLGKRNDLVGLLERGAQRLLHHHSRTGPQCLQHVPVVALRRGLHHDDVCPGGEIRIAHDTTAHTRHERGCALRCAGGNGAHLHTERRRRGCVRTRDHPCAAERNGGSPCHQWPWSRETTGAKASTSAAPTIT
ncbi:unannotated protein [freshwater metagenome]|uniref:Unannotated protein n=1 Tax=freshwater metagenome TaxID=449393 RepID=A0A6J7D548_9ZZZZ